MLPKFQYVSAESLKQLEELWEQYPQAVPICGGTDLLVQLRAGIRRAEVLVDLSRIPELQQIREEEKALFVGAGCTFARLHREEAVRAYAPILAQAAGEVGAPAIRNRASLGGNVGTASPAGDGLTALFASQAQASLWSTGGLRTLPMEELICGPKKTNIGSHEILLGFTIPKKSWKGAAFFKQGRRNALAISVVNGGVSLQISPKGEIQDSVIALGAVAPTPIRLKQAEALLKGRPWSEELGRELQHMVEKSVSPIRDIRAGKEYRRYIAGVLVRRTAEAILKGEEGTA